MILTQRQLDVLNHVVEDGQACADNAKQEAHVLAKVVKYEAEYDAKVLAFQGYSDAFDLSEEALAHKVSVITPTMMWEADMAKTDSTIPRWFEDYLTENAVTLAPGRAKDNYDAKVALRAGRPV